MASAALTPEQTESTTTKRYLVASFVLLGVCVGFFVGMSESPITATIIPLLFALLTGGAGLSLAKMDLSKQIDRRNAKFSAVCIITFTICCLVFAVYGVLVRTGAGLASFRPWGAKMAGVQVDIPIRLSDNLDNLAMALLIRRRLELIGATTTETNLALAKFDTLYGDIRSTGARAELQKIQKEIQDLLQRIGTNGTSSVRRSVPANSESMNQILRTLHAVDQRISSSIALIDRGGTLTQKAAMAIVSEYRDGMTDIDTDADERKRAETLLQGTGLSVNELILILQQLRLLHEQVDYVDHVDDLLSQIDLVIGFNESSSESGRAPRLLTRPSIKR